MVCFPLNHFEDDSNYFDQRTKILVWLLQENNFLELLSHFNPQLPIFSLNCRLKDQVFKKVVLYYYIDRRRFLVKYSVHHELKEIVNNLSVQAKLLVHFRHLSELETILILFILQLLLVLLQILISRHVRLVLILLNLVCSDSPVQVFKAFSSLFFDSNGIITDHIH